MKEPYYKDEEALRRAVKVSEENIKRLEEAIEKERETILEYKIWINELLAWKKSNGQ